MSSSSPASPASRPAPRIGAFFDMDKTLIAENSGSLYMKHRYERGDIDGWELARGLAAYLRYKVGILDIAAWSRDMMSQFAGEREDELEREAEKWLAQDVIDKIYPEAQTIVDDHLAQDHVVAIVSGSTRFVVAPLARHLGIEHILYTRLEVEEGRFTGRVIEPVCFEEGKIYWLQQLVDEQSIDLAKSYFYTDSITDLPLLELVGHPVVTNPDPRLYREAARRRWPVRFFDDPEEASPGSDAAPERERAAAGRSAPGDA